MIDREVRAGDIFSFRGPQQLFVVLSDPFLLNPLGPQHMFAKVVYVLHCIAGHSRVDINYATKLSDWIGSGPYKGILL